MKKFISLLAVCLIVLTSCAKSLSDDEAKAILIDLIPKAEVLNEIFWGKGLTPIDSEESKNGSRVPKYVQVLPDSPYHTIDELKKAASEVYSSEFLKIIYEMAFDGTEETISRYNESTDGKLQININEAGFKLHTKLFPERAKVKMGISGRVKILIPAEFDGEPYDDIEVTIVNENGSWRIDSPTY